MTDTMIADFSIASLCLLGALLLGVATRTSIAFKWLLAATAFVLINNLCLARFYGLVPAIPGLGYNWMGKALALATSLAIAARIGWADSGLQLGNRAAYSRSVWLTVAGYMAFVTALALAFPNDPAGPEDFGFQLTLPGLEEELFFRGLLLLALDRALRGRVRFLGVDWGWGAVISSALFGLYHAFGYSDGVYSFEPLFFALTALPSFVAVWLRYRTNSLLLPVVIHNLGNTISLIL